MYMEDNPFAEHFKEEIEARERAQQERDRITYLQTELLARRQAFVEQYSEMVIKILNDLRDVKYPGENYRVGSERGSEKWCIQRKGESRGGWGIVIPTLVDVVRVSLIFSDTGEPLSFMCDLVHGPKIQADLSKESLVKALLDLHTPVPSTKRELLQKRYCNVVSDGVNALWEVYHFANNINRGNSTLCEADPESHKDHLLWTLEHDRGDNLFHDWEIVFSIRLLLDTNDNPIGFECSNRNGTIRTGLLVDDLQKGLINLTEPKELPKKKGFWERFFS